MIADGSLPTVEPVDDARFDWFLVRLNHQHTNPFHRLRPGCVKVYLLPADTIAEVKALFGKGSMVNFVDIVDHFNNI